MYQNATARVRVVSSAASQICKEIGHEFLSPEHTLRALMLSEGCYATMLVRECFDTRPEQVIELLDRYVGERPEDAILKEANAKVVMDLAEEERKLRDHRLINTGHLLIALMRMDRSIAAQTLTHLKQSLDFLRRKLCHFVAIEAAKPRVQRVELSPNSFVLLLPLEASDDSDLAQHTELNNALAAALKGLNYTSIVVNTAPANWE